MMEKIINVDKITYWVRLVCKLCVGEKKNIEAKLRLEGMSEHNGCMLLLFKLTPTVKKYPDTVKVLFPYYDLSDIKFYILKMCHT